MLSKSGEIKPVSPDAAEPKPFADGKDGDLKLDVNFGNYDRSFLLRRGQGERQLLPARRRTRKNRFPRLAEEIGRAFDTFKQVEN